MSQKGLLHKTVNSIKKWSDRMDLSPLPRFVQELGKAMQFLFGFPLENSQSGGQSQGRALSFCAFISPQGVTLFFFYYQSISF